MTKSPRSWLMAQALPIHVVSSDSERRDRVLKALDGWSTTLHESIAELHGPIEDARCVVVVDSSDGAAMGDVLALCREVADRDQEKLVFLAEDGDGSVTFRPLAVGFAVKDQEIDEVLDPDGDTWPPFDLHEILRFIARIRHDINNPLTAGMAETQLLLMDLGEEGEVGESLVTIQRQLKRIQGLVQDLAHLRRPPADSGA
ncbi:MAG: histidine kinase dimerization/phospho-acceptor domain-containing protein [Gemmatimonadota bacterium]